MQERERTLKGAGGLSHQRLSALLKLMAIASGTSELDKDDPTKPHVDECDGGAYRTYPNPH